MFFWYTRVHECSMCGEARWWSLVERVFLLVQIGFVEVHFGKVSGGGGYVRGVVWYIFYVFVVGGFMVCMRG